MSLTRALVLASGPLCLALVLVTPPPAGMDEAAWRVTGIAAWMMLWWVTEALPLAVTALLPILLLPLAGVMDTGGATQAYAHPVVFLFLGGFLLALAIQQCGLHERIALAILTFGGSQPARVVAAFMVATAMLSMWISNTATAALLLPVALSILALVEDDHAEWSRHRFTPALLVGIAYAANIGGMATLIGTPPNAILAGYLGEHHGISVSFIGWMAVGLPLACVLLAVAWWLLVRVSFPLGERPLEHLGAMVADRRRLLGGWTRPQRLVAGVFLAAALLWLLRPALNQWLPELHDAHIALGAGVLAFLLPAAADRRSLLEWKDTQQLPWGVLLLIGGGLSLGAAVVESGLADWIAAGLAATRGWSIPIMVAAVAAVAMALSHVTSNTAAAATLIPIATTTGIAAGLPPLLLAMPVALAASCAFLLPTATPPNAIVFGSERLKVLHLIRAGAPLSAAALLGLAAGAALFSLVSW